MRYKKEIQPLNASEATALTEGDGTGVKAAHFWSWGGGLRRAWGEGQHTRRRAVGTHLTALAGADPIVVPRGLVLADEAGFVHAGGRKWRRRARDEFLRAGALCFNRYNGEREKVDFSSFLFTSEFLGLCPPFSDSTSRVRPTKPVAVAGTAEGTQMQMGCSAVYKAIPHVSFIVRQVT